MTRKPAAARTGAPSTGGGERDRLLAGGVQLANLFRDEYVDVQERNPGQSRTFLLAVAPRF